LAVTISTAAALAGTTIATTATATTIKTIAMTTLQKTLITATLAVAVGTGIYEARQAAHSREENQTLQQQQAPLTEQILQLSQAFAEATNQIATLHEDNGRLNRNTAELLKLRGEFTRLRGESKELAQLKAGDFEKTNNLTEVTVRNWLARAADLIQRIEQMPETKIPEFQFLTATDWLDVARKASLDTDSDVHNAAQMLGTLAKDEFATLMKAALNKFIEANAGELPTEIAQLKPFFPGPVEDGVLQRYEVLRSGNVKDVPELDRSLRLVAERRWAPVGSGRPIVLVGTNGYMRTGQ